MNSTAHVDELVQGRVMEIDLHGRLTREDYEMFVPETERLIRAYGNHPSFLLLSPSNEPSGRWKDVLDRWIARSCDDRPRTGVSFSFYQLRWPRRILRRCDLS